jgi:phage anti-repressor protein
MNEIEKNRYHRCLTEMVEDSVFKDARMFIELKDLEEKFPEETKEIRLAVSINLTGVY